MLCNVADVPDLCNFILPAVHREGPIAVAVSTGGASPALAKRLRSQIAELVGPEHAELAEELRALASRGEGALPHLRGAARLLRGSRDGAARMTVFLVGAGPGDPGLVTVRGLELIRSCDALVYDVLVAPELVEEAPDDAILISRESVRQGELNELLVELGRAGLDVVRLKGGDPFIFGRGGEEAEALVEAGIPWEVVPGVSALSAVPASVGIPVTHRGVSAQVTLVSGHSASGEDLDFAQLASTPGTLVVFMGLGHLSVIADGLIAAGKDRHHAGRGRLAGTLPTGGRCEASSGTSRGWPRISPRRRCSWSATSSRSARASAAGGGQTLRERERVDPRRVGPLVGRDRVLTLQREADLVEAVHEHVAVELGELERDPKAVRVRDLERLEVDGAARSPPRAPP